MWRVKDQSQGVVERLCGVVRSKDFAVLCDELDAKPVDPRPLEVFIHTTQLLVAPHKRFHRLEVPRYFFWREERKRRQRPDAFSEERFFVVSRRHGMVLHKSPHSLAEVEIASVQSDAELPEGFDQSAFEVDRDDEVLSPKH